MAKEIIENDESESILDARKRMIAEMEKLLGLDGATDLSSVEVNIDLEDFSVEERRDVLRLHLLHLKYAEMLKVFIAEINTFFSKNNLVNHQGTVTELSEKDFYHKMPSMSQLKERGVTLECITDIVFSASEAVDFLLGDDRLFVDRLEFSLTLDLSIQLHGKLLILSKEEDLEWRTNGAAGSFDLAGRKKEAELGLSQMLDEMPRFEKHAKGLLLAMCIAFGDNDSSHSTNFIKERVRQVVKLMKKIHLQYDAKTASNDYEKKIAILPEEQFTQIEIEILKKAKECRENGKKLDTADFNLFLLDLFIINK